MEGAGLGSRTDSAGNVVGRREGPPGSRTLIIGSHLDTVPNAGRYDGILGVLVGIAVAEAVRDEAFPFALEVIGFSEEEGVRFRRPYLGSLAVAGRFDPGLLSLADAAGATVRQAIEEFGLDPARIPLEARDPAGVLGFAEVHIEQGPVLETQDLPVGVVETIIGQERLVLTMSGVCGHAGTVPMQGRRDAAVGMARAILAVREVGRSVPGLRATVGSVELRPNVRNVIAGEARFSLDVRHAGNEVRRRAVEEIVSELRRVAAEEQLEFQVLARSAEDSVPMDPGLAARLAGCVEECGVRPLTLVSGAGHDAAVMGQVFPSVMLFIRNRGGISHHPDESVDPGDVAVGIDVMTRFLRKFS